MSADETKCMKYSFISVMNKYRQLHCAKLLSELSQNEYFTMHSIIGFSAYLPELEKVREADKDEEIDSLVELRADLMEKLLKNEITFSDKFMRKVMLVKLTEIAGYSPPALSRTLKNLEQKGFVERSVDEKDRRNIYVTVLPKGLEVWLEENRKLYAFLQGVIETFTPEKADTFIKLLDEFYLVMDKKLGEYIEMK